LRRFPSRLRPCLVNVSATAHLMCGPLGWAMPATLSSSQVACASSLTRS